MARHSDRRFPQDSLGGGGGRPSPAEPRPASLRRPADDEAAQEARVQAAVERDEDLARRIGGDGGRKIA
jgi:hypothetical protein